MRRYAPGDPSVLFLGRADTLESGPGVGSGRAARQTNPSDAEIKTICDYSPATASSRCPNRAEEASAAGFYSLLQTDWSGASPATA